MEPNSGPKIFSLLVVFAFDVIAHREKLTILEFEAKDRYFSTLSDYSVIFGAEKHEADAGETNPCGHLSTQGYCDCLRTRFPTFTAGGLVNYDIS